MSMHVHADFVHYVIFLAFFIITMVWMKILAAKYADTTIGKALGFVVA